MKYTLILSALLVCGSTLAASAAPKPTAHVKVAPKKATQAAAPANVKAIRPIPGGFPDVPADHWAAQSVETLRRAGIVKGYPAHGK